MWYYTEVGKKRCSIVDTYWQTETGGHVLTPLPGVTPMKPGSASFPFFGVKPILLDETGAEVVGEGEGALAFAAPWPGIMRTVYNNHERFEATYFSKFPGFYFTGDGRTFIPCALELCPANESFLIQVPVETKTATCG